MGGDHFAAVLLDGKWVPVSSCPGARYVGRDHGYNLYDIEVADDAVTAQFDRSNRGNEHVEADNGLSWGSFDEAHRWAAGEHAPATCPRCGRLM